MSRQVPRKLSDLNLKHETVKTRDWDFSKAEYWTCPRATLCFNSRDLISHLARWEIPLASVGDSCPLKEVHISHPERDRYRNFCKVSRVTAVISWSGIAVWHIAASSHSRTFLKLSFVCFVFPTLCSKRTVHSSWGAGSSGALLLNAENLSVPVGTSGHPPEQRMALVSLSTPGSWAD